MKFGTISRSMERPSEGFTFRREGHEIYISYIEPNSIKEVEIQNIDETTSIEYEYTLYSYYGSIDSYEKLVSKCVLLKYTIEEELSLVSKAIANSDNEQYVTYREFVELAKTECKNIYTELGLIRENIY